MASEVPYDWRGALVAIVHSIAKHRREIRRWKHLLSKRSLEELEFLELIRSVLEKCMTANPAFTKSDFYSWVDWMEDMKPDLDYRYIVEEQFKLRDLEKRYYALVKEVREQRQRQPITDCADWLIVPFESRHSLYQEDFYPPSDGGDEEFYLLTNEECRGRNSGETIARCARYNRVSDGGIDGGDVIVPRSVCVKHGLNWNPKSPPKIYLYTH